MIAQPAPQQGAGQEAIKELAWLRQHIHKDEDGYGVVIRGITGHDLRLWIDRADVIIERAKE
jgi:hypothetical protein